MAAAKENKVQLNLKNVHYAVLNDEATPGYATPVPVPGAVNLNLAASGEMTPFYADAQANTAYSVLPFYADGIVYYKSSANNGYEGDLEMARFIDQMMQDIWNNQLDETDKVMIEKADVEAKAFALLFQIDGDANNDLYVLYNCTGTRPAIAAATSTETKTPTTQTSTISAAPLAANYFVYARTTADTPENVRTNWFKQVWMPSAEPAAAKAAADSAPVRAEAESEA